MLFQPTLSAWRETGSRTLTRANLTISTHSLRMERDRTGGRSTGQAEKFQPTLSAWRETVAINTVTDIIVISTHSLRMERDSKSV